MQAYTFVEDAGNGTTYGNGVHTTCLTITKVATGEQRRYWDWTYMEAEDEEDEQFILNAIWEADETLGYEDWDYEVI